MELKEIRITDIGGFRIGQAEDREAATGVTAIICEKGASAGVDVRGGGPASRETELLSPRTSTDKIHAVVLSGGSAFGLGAANGVMQYLAERGIGYETNYALVPLVCQSDIYDLGVGRADVRPDPVMGYAAAKAAFEGEASPERGGAALRTTAIEAQPWSLPCGEAGYDWSDQKRSEAEGLYRDGNHGAGTGASVGKCLGKDYAMKSGIGSYAVELGPLKIGAVVVVNALGDVYDHETGEKLAGLLSEDKEGFRDSAEVLVSMLKEKVVDNKFTGNTTIGAVITNATCTKAQAGKLAAMGSNGFVRSISPVNTSVDGDSLYAMASGEVHADQDLLGILAAEVVAKAVERAVLSAESAYGLKGCRA